MEKDSKAYGKDNESTKEKKKAKDNDNAKKPSKKKKGWIYYSFKNIIFIKFLLILFLINLIRTNWFR